MLKTPSVVRTLHAQHLKLNSWIGKLGVNLSAPDRIHNPAPLTNLRSEL